MTSPMNLAIFKVNNLGDNVVFLPVVQTLRARHPDWRFFLFTSRNAAGLYTGLVPPERLIACTRKEFHRAWARPWRLARWLVRLRHFSADASLVAPDQGSIAHLLARVAGGTVRAGGAGVVIRLRGTLTHSVPFAAPQTIAQWNWEVARALYAALGERDWPAEPPPPDLRPLIRRLPGPPRSGRIVIHAGASREYQRWPVTAYAELAERLARDWEVVWLQGPELDEVRLAPAVRVERRESLAELVSWLASASLYIGNNSGPMHLVSALGRPAVILCGPTHPCWDPCWHRERLRLLRAPGLGCLPCDHHDFGADQCNNREQPMACMAYWRVPMIEAICREWLHQWVET
jgi:ADP-heptose:LPS heptosyltransferase